MSNAPLLVTFTESLGTAGDNIQVTFTSQVSGGTSPYQYEWDFGDDVGKSTTQNAVYTYLLSRNEKIMRVTLQVTDANKKTTAINSILLPSKPLPFGLDNNALRSLQITSAMTAITIALLSIFMTIYPNLVGVTLTAGALGGFLHEYVQSKGTVLFIAKKEDGLYLGSITGLILGAVAGLFVLEGNINNTQEMVPIFLESIIAGLALKGVSEAATGSPKESEDDFEIIAAAHTSGKINIQIRNKMLHDLELKQVVITDSGQAMHAEQVPSQSRKVAAKQIIGFDIPVKVLKGPTIKITVISRNSEKEIHIPF